MSRALDAGALSLQQHFGAGVACAVVPVDGEPANLWRAEQELVAGAVLSRRREFAAGRACARTLLARLGFEPAALLIANDRSPLWPSGATGSIAHDGRLCAVAVVRTERLYSLGLDIEPDEPLEPDVWPELFVARELAALAARPQHERGRLARLFFSAKECVYKCAPASVRSTLGFLDVEIELAPGSDRFRALLRQPAETAAAQVAFAGFYLACAGSILTGTSLTSPSGRPARRSTTAGSSV